jgi:multiple sugar transport system substrate-binding protein
LISMGTRHFRFLSVLILVVLVGCTSLPFGLGGSAGATPTTINGTQQPTPTKTVSATQAPTSTSSQQAENTPQPNGESVLRIWVPPEFNPQASSAAGQMLNARLHEFMSANPGLRLDVRVKALAGEGGMIESLVAANVAAPLAVPDLVLLSRPLLESATLKGLLYPFDGLTGLMDDPNWYDYARQLSRIQSSTYGIPVAGDALALVYQPVLTETLANTLEDLLSLGEPLDYPAADPQALFTISLYLAQGGRLQDDQGRPMLDKDELINIFEFIKQASEAGMMPTWLTQYANDSQVWEAFLNNQYHMAITWVSTYLSHLDATSDGLALTRLPTMSNVPFTLATGWSWALSSQDATRRQLAVRLAEYLADKDFLAQWTSAAGYLPPKKDALQDWQNGQLRSTVDQISISAELTPPVDMLSSIGPAIEQALVSVLKAQSDPQTAAQAVINQVNRP